jgi:transcription elongation factor Elf1
MTMRLLNRIKRMEAALPKPPGPCPSCGDIDPVTFCGLMRGGIRFHRWDKERGRDLVWCKLCLRRFTCEVGPKERNGYWVKEVLFDPPSRYPPRSDDEPI